MEKSKENLKTEISQIGNTNIRVFIRTRPLLQKEFGKELALSCDKEGKKVILNDPIDNIEYTFDSVFGEKVNQKEIFNHICPFVSQVFSGYNISIFAYGQTGSGKTYTMFGADWENLFNNNNSTNNNEFLSNSLLKINYQATFFENLEADIDFAGVIPRVIFEIYCLQSKMEVEENKKFNIYCSFIQIYNEKVFDLLQDQLHPKCLNIHESKLDGIFVEGLAEYAVSNYQDCLSLMRRGEKNRIIRQTTMNTKSSRSHTIFQIVIESAKADKNGKLMKSKINLCDLAGSEKINKNEEMEADHFKELKNINLSLTTLGKVINILSKNSKLPPPYRESKLTRLLQDSLGGNTQTFVICTLNPTNEVLEETLSTLKFAERAKNIKVKIKPNEIHALDESLVAKLQNEIKYLRELLNMKRKGISANEIQKKFVMLKEENEKLRSNTALLNYNVQDVEKLIAENKKMKEELMKVKNSTNSEIYTESETKSTKLETFSQKKDDFFNEFLSFDNKEKLDIILNSNKKANHYSIKSSNKSFKIVDQPKTEVQVRVKGKNNNYLLQKGFVEVSNEEDKRQLEKKKQRIRALERLRDLERIQKNNEEKFNLDMKK